MAVFADFYPYLRPQLTGALDYTIDREIRDACRRFCRDTHVWRADLNITPVIGTDTYTLPAPVDSEVIRVRTVVQNNATVSPLSADMLNINNPAYAQQSAMTAEYYEIPSTGVIRLLPIPASTNIATVSVALSPTITAVTIPQFLFDEWVEGIVAGVLSSMFAQAGQAWSSPDFAGYQRSDYLRTVNNAKHRVSVGDSSFNSTVQVHSLL